MNSAVYTQRIQRQLTACEGHADQLMLDSATLLAEMTKARMDCGAFGTGQRAISAVLAAQASVAEAQMKLMRAHHDLLKIGQERGDIMTEDCPPPVRGLQAEVA